MSENIRKSKTKPGYFELRVQDAVVLLPEKDVTKEMIEFFGSCSPDDLEIVNIQDN